VKSTVAKTTNLTFQLHSALCNTAQNL